MTPNKDKVLFTAMLALTLLLSIKDLLDSRKKNKEEK